MRILGLVPIAALLLLGLFAWLTLRTDVPFYFPDAEPPVGEIQAQPDVPAGDATLSGRVLGERDAGLPGVLVAIVGSPRLLWTFTDSDGRFRITEVPRGKAFVSILARGYPPEVREVEAGGGALELHLATRVAALPTLGNVARSDIVGSVLLPGGETFLAGYEVACLPLAPPERLGGAVPRRVLVDANGRFEVPDLAHGDYRLLLLPPWARGGSWPDLLGALAGPAVTLEHPRGAGASELELVARNGVIRGVITDRRGRAGAQDRSKFVQGAMVLVRARAANGTAQASPRLWPPSATDAEGAFRVADLPPGTYDVTVIAGDARLEREVTVHPQSIMDVDFAALDDR